MIYKKHRREKNVARKKTEICFHTKWRVDLVAKRFGERRREGERGRERDTNH